MKLHKDTFEKISEQRKEKLVSVAISEFARNGYNATNINNIAEKAGISIGSMYSYFASKEDLFLYIVEEGYEMLESAFAEINIEEGDIFNFFEQLFRTAQKYARTYPEMNQIYLDITTQGLSKLSKRLSYKIESITAVTYKEIINKAKGKGIIDKDIDENLLSFILDNLVIMYQFSYTSDYYKERMKIFLGSESIDEEKVIEGIMKYIKRAFIVKEV